MPDYTYRCHGDFDAYFPMGGAPRFVPCEVCGRPADLVIGAGVHIAPSALENKGEAVRATNAREDRWHKDMPAYKRMRDHGMQPRNIDGAARVEDNVGDQIDISFGHMYAKDTPREQVREAVIEAEEMHLMGTDRPIRRDYANQGADDE